MLRVTDIKINYMREPKGVSGALTVGWKLESDHQNVTQAGYELKVSGEADGSRVLYRTDYVSSRESVCVEVPDLNWDSLRYYYIFVRAHDNRGEVSPWHKTRFLSALRLHDFQAKFITAERPGDRTGSPGTMVRGTFQVKKPVREAFLVSTALGLYQAYLNGKRVGNDELTPGWTSYRKRLLCQSYDVSGCLRQGENVLGALLGAGWYKGDITWNRVHNYYGDYTAFAGQLLIRYQDGSEEIVTTNEDFRGHYAPILHADLYDGETYDARQECGGWAEAGSAEEGWRPVSVVDVETEILVPQQGCTVRIQEMLPVKERFVTPAGDTVLDFGQNLSGWVRFTVQGEPGDVAELVCFETLDAAGNVYTDNLRTAKQTLRYICRGTGAETWQPHFTFQGFRYVWVKSWPGELRPENFTACVLHSDMRVRGAFTSSHPLLNRLQQNILWSMRGNSVDVPTDCPQRDERLGWTGDAQIFCRSANFLMDTYEFYRKWLCDVRADQRQDGGISHVAPDVLADNAADPSYGASGWGDVIVVMTWALYQESGNPAIIRQQYESMKKWVDYIEAHNDNGWIQTAWQYGDWLALDAAEGSYHGATPNDFVSLAYHIYTSGLLSRMAKILGEQADAAYYAKIRERALFCFRKNYCLPNGKLTVKTQTACVLALYFHLIPKEQIPVVRKELLGLLAARGGSLATGFLGTPYLLQALSENGCLEEAYGLLLREDYPSWLYQVKQGATTVWEHWDGQKPDGSMWSADMNSFNHYAYGAVCQWFYEKCAGLQMEENHPGYRQFVIRPGVSRALDFAEIWHNCNYGRIRVRWEWDEDCIVLSLEIPPNTAARIVLDDVREVAETTGIVFTRSDSGFQGETGSGTWRIVYRSSIPV